MGNYKKKFAREPQLNVLIKLYRQFDTYPSADTFYLNPSIQQHFEQFSLVSIQCRCSVINCCLNVFNQNLYYYDNERSIK